MPESDESQKAFRKLVNHTFWAALAFVAIILIAVGLDEFVHFLRWEGAVAADSPLEWAILTAKYGLLAIDVVLLVGAVAKLAWRAWRSL